MSLSEDNKKIKLVMFDMDGVLFDSMPYHATSWNKAMKDFGLELSEAEAYMHEGRTGSGTINIITQRQLGREADEEECKRIYACKSKYFNSCPTAQRMPGAFETVSKVKECGITPIIVTGSGQVSLMEKALDSLLQAKKSMEDLQDISLIEIDIKNAFDYLGEITGEANPEELITALFTKFCLGK